jgi:hypothetical protein
MQLLGSTTKHTGGDVCKRARRQATPSVLHRQQWFIDPLQATPTPPSQPPSPPPYPTPQDQSPSPPPPVQLGAQPQQGLQALCILRLTGRPASTKHTPRRQLHVHRARALQLQASQCCTDGPGGVSSCWGPGCCCCCCCANPEDGEEE